MHNPALVTLGLDWRYLACDVHPERLREAIAGAQAMKFIGLNLTVPHKLLAVNIVDELDVSARTWGAVNTVRFEAKDLSGGWQPLAKLNPEEVGEMRSVGFNTDADAITRSLSEDLDLELGGASVLLLGAGGAGRTAALKLAADGVGSLWLHNRTASKAEEVAAEIRKRFPRVKVMVGYPEGSVDLLLNATSLGLKATDASPLDESKFALHQARNVYDMIYRPAETPLLRAAKAAGCKTANGLGMLLYQGAQALEIWTGKFAPVEVMRAALVKNVYANA
ncbi:MAG: shikimate dehydrogenase [Proteobacteria bacterium]|nr:shikimate dehydrogenase [Pseudomonadota bacterium]